MTFIIGQLGLFQEMKRKKNMERKDFPDPEALGLIFENKVLD
jgi:hypothetical protein